MTDIKPVALTDEGVKFLKEWLATHGKKTLYLDVIEEELLDIMAERLIANETTVYELSAQYTLSGRPECITMRPEHLSI